jgi:hypothetical protein
MLVVVGVTVEVTGMLEVMGTEVVIRMLVVAGIEVVEATELVVEGIIVVVVVERVEEEVELELVDATEFVVVVEVLIEERATPHASEVFLLSLFDVSYAVRDK